MGSGLTWRGLICLGSQPNATRAAMGIDHVALGSDWSEESRIVLDHENWLRVLGDT